MKLFEQLSNFVFSVQVNTVLFLNSREEEQKKQRIKNNDIMIAEELKPQRIIIIQEKGGLKHHMIKLSTYSPGEAKSKKGAALHTSCFIVLSDTNNVTHI